MALGKPNVGVGTNSQHDLWIAATDASVEEPRNNDSLEISEVSIVIRSTGICG